MDVNGNLYFDTTLFTHPILSTARGVFKDGAVLQAGTVKGLPITTAPPWPPKQIIDIYGGGVTFDGNSLYLSDFQVKTDDSGNPRSPIGGKITLFTKKSD